MPQPDITLAMPAYNERDNIARVVRESVEHLQRQGRAWEILVIDNDSSDGTAEEVRRLMSKEPRIRLIVHEENRFYSGSCQTALEQSRGRYVAIMDSDGQFTADDIPKFVKKIDAGANLVFGWRKRRRDPFFRKVVSFVFNCLGRYWLGVRLHDLNVGLRVFDRRFVAAGHIRHRLNMANPELYTRAKLAGLTIDETEIQHFARREGAVCHDFRKMGKLFLDVNRYLKTLRAELDGGSPPAASESDDPAKAA